MTQPEQDIQSEVLFSFICRWHGLELVGFPNWSLVYERPDRFVPEFSGFVCPPGVQEHIDCTHTWIMTLEETDIPIRPTKTDITEDSKDLVNSLDTPEDDA